MQAPAPEQTSQRNRTSFRFRICRPNRQQPIWLARRKTRRAPQDEVIRSRGTSSAPELCCKTKRRSGLCEAICRSPSKWRASGAHDPEKWCPVFGPRSWANKKGKAERRKAHCPTMSAPTDKSAKLVCARRAHCFPARPPFGAHACGTRHRLLPRWLSSRTGFPAAAANESFARFARKMPRLSTLRADRSLCRSTGDPKPPGNGRDELPRAGTASRYHQIGVTG
jgi:hypothetical protein